MKLKSSSFLIAMVFCFTFFVGAQTNINAYKYLIVPTQYDFQKSEDQYKLNSLTKFLFEKEGFQVVNEGEDQPQDLYENPCLALKAILVNNSSLFTTKIVINLEDCRGSVVFSSNEGKSKIKEFKRSYQEAVRRAFESVKTLNYRYDSNATIDPRPVSNTIKEQVIDVVDQKEEVIEKPTQEIKEVVEDKEKALEDQVAPIQEKEAVHVVAKTTANVLYAQPIENGFQLVDKTPKIVFIALKATTQDLYFLKNNAGVLYKESEKWFVEYYKNGALVKEELTIKF